VSVTETQISITAALAEAEARVIEGRAADEIAISQLRHTSRR